MHTAEQQEAPVGVRVDGGNTRVDPHQSQQSAWLRPAAGGQWF